MFAFADKTWIATALKLLDVWDAVVIFMPSVWVPETISRIWRTTVSNNEMNSTDGWIII